MILDYNIGKCGVDTLDQLVRTYNCYRTTNRWPVVLFMNLLNISAYNALVLFLSIHPEYEQRSGQPRKRFLIRLAKSLIGIQHAPQLPLRAVLQAAGAPAVGPQPAVAPKQRRCDFCPRHRDRKTKTICKDCKRPLCSQHAVIKCPNC